METSAGLQHRFGVDCKRELNGHALHRTDRLDRSDDKPRLSDWSTQDDFLKRTHDEAEESLVKRKKLGGS